MVKGKGVIWHH